MVEKLVKPEKNAEIVHSISHSKMCVKTRSAANSVNHCKLTKTEVRFSFFLKNRNFRAGILGKNIKNFAKTVLTNARGN